ncbi:MAG: hypothetical protein ABI759_03605 [Candidatus Solibacter sp.]
MRKIAGLFMALTALGQTPPAGEPGGGALALVRFQVAPQKGGPAGELQPQDVEIREDGVTRKVVVLEGGTIKQREIPIEISLLFDCTRSALSSGTLSPRVFHEALLDEFPNVSISVYGFAPGLSRLATPTRDQAQLAKALEAPLLVHPLSTFLMDHVSRVMIDAASNPGAAVRMIVAVSTGKTDDGASSETQMDERYKRAVGIAQQSNLAAFPVVLTVPLASQDSTPTPAAPRASRVAGPQIGNSEITASTLMRAAGNFANLGAVTGGKRFDVLSAGNMLTSILKWLADEIRSEYVAGFEVAASRDKKRHKIEVIMRNKDRGRVSTGALSLVY